MFPNYGPRAALISGLGRACDFILDPIEMPVPASTAPLLFDLKTSRTIVFSQTAGGAGRAYDPLIGRSYIGYAGGMGTYRIPFSPLYALPASNAAPVNPVHVWGIQFRTDNLALSPAGQDQGFFFKTTANALTSGLYVNSVAYGVIPGDERALGVNRNVAGGFDFVSIVGGIGRVTTPLVWPVADARFPVNVEFRFFEATTDSPIASFELWIGAQRVIRSPMAAGNAFGLPFNFDNSLGRCLWLPVFRGFDATRVCGFTEFYYRCGPTLAGTA